MLSIGKDKKNQKTQESWLVLHVNIFHLYSTLFTKCFYIKIFSGVQLARRFILHLPNLNHNGARPLKIHNSEQSVRRKLLCLCKNLLQVLLSVLYFESFCHKLDHVSVGKYYETLGKGTQNVV